MGKMRKPILDKVNVDKIGGKKSQGQLKGPVQEDLDNKVSWKQTI